MILMIMLIVLHFAVVPNYVFTDAITAQRPVPVITGQNCHPLHNTTVHQHGDNL